MRLLRGPEPLQLRIELHPGDPERGRRSSLVALGLREGIRDRVSLELLKARRRCILIFDACRRGYTRQGRLAGREPRPGEPELCGGDEPGVRNDQRSLDRVLELADVPGPRVRHQQLPGVATQPRLPLAHPLAQAADEFLGEEHHVLAALAQRRQVNRKDAEPVIEILTELATRHCVREVSVGGDYEAKVGLERRGATDALELALLEDTEKFGLDGRRELADLVEKERAPGSELEAARLLPVRSGEGAPFMAEELRLDERFWQRRAVDGDAGAVGATAGIVDRLGHQLLARAALAGQEHGGLPRSDPRGPLERLAQAGGLAEDPAEPVRLAEGVMQPLNSPLELLRPQFGNREPALLLGQPLMLDRDDDVLGNLLDDLEIALVEPVRLMLGETQA